MSKPKDWREVECEACEGTGSWDVYTGGYDPIDGSLNGYVETCTYCAGRGVCMQEVEPITLEDLPDAFGEDCRNARAARQIAAAGCQRHDA